MKGTGAGRVDEANVDTPGAPSVGMRRALAAPTLRRGLLIGLVLLMSGYGALEVGVPILVTVMNGFAGLEHGAKLRAWWIIVLAAGYAAAALMAARLHEAPSAPLDWRVQAVMGERP